MILWRIRISNMCTFSIKWDFLFNRERSSHWVSHRAYKSSKIEVATDTALTFTKWKEEFHEMSKVKSPSKREKRKKRSPKTKTNCLISISFARNMRLIIHTSKATHEQHSLALAAKLRALARSKRWRKLNRKPHHNRRQLTLCFGCMFFSLQSTTTPSCTTIIVIILCAFVLANQRKLKEQMIVSHVIVLCILYEVNVSFSVMSDWACFNAPLSLAVCACLCLKIELYAMCTMFAAENGHVGFATFAGRFSKLKDEWIIKVSKGKKEAPYINIWNGKETNGVAAAWKW